ncbi:hypothetical protein Tco_0494906 [Tanacetum coccineum]
MASFDYRLNPLYAIKECSSCGALYTTDYCCSNVGLVDKIIRDPNPISYDETPDSPSQPQTSSLNQRHCFHCKDPLEEHEHCKRCTCMRCGSGLSKGFCFICASSNKNSSQRLPNCPKCGDPVEGLYCRQCALNRKKLEEVFQDFQDTFESSNDNTNVVNAPQEPFVVKQDPGVNSSQSPPHINHHCCYECGDSLDDIFCQQCTFKSCGKGAHYGYNCPPKVLNPKLCNNQTVDELPQTLPSFDPTYYSGDGSSFTYDSTPNFVNDSPNVFNHPPQPQYMPYSCELCGNDGHHDYDCLPQVPFIPICYDDDDDEESSIPLKDIIISGLPLCVAITPVLLTEEPVDSLIMEDEHLDTILATESDEVIKSSVENLVQIPSESEGIPDSVCDVPLCNNPTPLEAFKEHSEIVVDFNDDSTSSDDDSPYGEDIDYVDASPPDAEIVSSEVVEIVIPEVGGIDTDILLTIKDDILREKLLNVNLLIANIEALKDNPTPSSDFVTKSSSTSLNLFLEETNTFDNSLPESETFCFNLEEISSGSTTTLSDYSLPDYEAFYLDDDHIEEKSSGSTTTHADFSQYDSFIFDLSINPFPPADRSDFYHEEFADELAHIISPSEYDCFYFKSEPDLGELTSIVDSGIRENVLSTTNVNLPFEDDQSPLLAYVVWIFLSFLTYSVAPPYLLFCGNEDTIFDPGISVYHSFMPSVSHRRGTFMKFNVYPNHLNESSMEILSSTCSPVDCPDCDDSRARGFVLRSQEL